MKTSTRFRLPSGYWIGVVVAIAGAGCAGIHAARMAVPASLQDRGVWWTVEGVGGAAKGQFTVGPYRGSFQRSATRTAFFDSLYERTEASVTLELAGPGMAEALRANCRMRERGVTIGIVSFSPQRLAYRCEFTQAGDGVSRWLELQEQRETLGSLGRRTRAGLLAQGSSQWVVRSVHELEGSALPLGPPAGYVMERDGRPIAAVELLGLARMLTGETLPDDAEPVVVAAALSLALLWEPERD